MLGRRFDPFRYWVRSPASALTFHGSLSYSHFYVMSQQCAWSTCCDVIPDNSEVAKIPKMFNCMELICHRPSQTSVSALPKTSQIFPYKPAITQTEEERERNVYLLFVY